MKNHDKIEDFNARLEKLKKGELTLDDFTAEERIELLERNEISQEEFLAHLPKKLRDYWDTISKLLAEKRIFRNVEAAEVLPLNVKGKYPRLNMSRGILTKFKEWGLLETIRIQNHNVYFCALPGFYSLEELLKLVPKEYQKNILELMPERWLKVQELAETLNVNPRFLEEILDAFVEKGWLIKSKSGYRKSVVLEEAGISVESLQGLELVELHNLLIEKQELKGSSAAPQNLAELKEAIQKDIDQKTVKPLRSDVDGDSIRLTFLGEVRFGNQFTDIQLIEWGMKMLKQYMPHYIITSDFIQGDFRGIQVERLRSLTRTGGLYQIETQHKAAEVLLKELESIAQEKVIYQLSDDDWQVALSRVIIALEQYRNIRKLGATAFWPEEIKRRSGADYYRLMKIQWEIIQPYMYRIGRSLLNAEETEKVIGDRISELLVIIFILLFEEFDQPIPAKYENLVDIEALHGDKVDSKRIVTPDPIHLDLPAFDDKKILAQHNIAFSDITQYIDSGFIPESILRHLQASGKKTPYLWVDFHQERFWGTKVFDTFIFNLPGCQNPTPVAEGQIKTFHTKVLSDKAHRQITVRKEPPTPGIVNFEIFKDGRLKIYPLNDKIKSVVEAQKDQPERKDILAYTSDWQLGSITMRPEWGIKFCDYALYTRHGNILIINGDLIQGFHYPRFVSENRPKRLVSVSSQKAFTLRILEPLFPAPNLEAIDLLMGNHESEIWGADITGQNNLEFLFFALTELYNQQKKFGALKKYPDIKMWSRIRNPKTTAPGGSTINHPYAARRLSSGFKYVVQHQFYPRGGGRTPLHEQMRWVRNIAKSIADAHILLGGHKHTFWITQVAELIMLQLPGFNDQSAFEFARGLMPEPMGCIIEFSNRTGITIELVPIEFLEKYKCISPAYKEIDAQGLLDRPKPGTREYQYGFDSPFLHELEETIDSEYQEI
ncbi:MAG TPA: hypothetical protein PLX73_00815 [Candidatus Paceibacterota bacterium]|nr:hypothetical protein [Candidatus Paceibacterota bacterium]HPP16916.1 hypothetical protein [Candidatus Paceibacterota bacterium]HRU33472.1 hypothetical protein [Candidatus Paceibacterota bacterium]